MKAICSAIFFALFLEISAQELKKDPTDGCPTFEMVTEDTTWVMKQYYMVIYLSGESRDQDSATAAKIQEGHLAHIGKLGDDGLLSIAGPFGDNTDMRGILIFNVPDAETVHKLVDADPAVVAGRLRYEVHAWWGAKGSKLM